MTTAGRRVGETSTFKPCGYLRKLPEQPPGQT
jgi:hypothetical protein